ncbi:MAG: rRNA maturation RNase YbeY [Spirochaetaceae bacterium]|nr:MAG: rRNA maturation RNase YbeY [Spirochaetaceae bacterium]
MKSGNTVEIRAEPGDSPSWLAALATYIHAVLALLGVENRELSVLITDDPTMQDLNKRFRAIDEPTDVLSFGDDPPEETGPMGDLVIDLAQVGRQAPLFHVTAEEELRRVTVHGILHLLGHRHQTDDLMAEPMLQLQEELLQTVEERLF